MNSNLAIFIIIILGMFILSMIWGVFYALYLKKMEIGNSKANNLTPNGGLLSAIKTDTNWSDFNDECPIVLPNTDDNVADTLKYIGVSKYSKDMLGNLYEQTRI